MEEARRTYELFNKAKRETAPTRAQQQAARPVYTLEVEREKQVRGEGAQGLVREKGEGRQNDKTNSRMLIAGSGGEGAQGVRGSSEGRRRSTRRTEDGVELPPHTNNLQGLQTTSRELSFRATKMQVLPMQPAEARDANRAKGLCAGGREAGANAGVATRGQRTWERRSGPQWGRGSGRQRQRREGGMVKEGEGKWVTQKGARRS
eukprot:408257-Pleurochrysis_carterae.AAC.2